MVDAAHCLLKPGTILFMIGTLFSEPRRLAVELCILFLLYDFEREVGC